MIKCNKYINLLGIYITLYELPHINFVSLKSEIVEDCDKYLIVNDCDLNCLNFKNPCTNAGVIQLIPK